MMKDFMLFLSHVLNLILVAVMMLLAGIGIGYYDTDGIVSDIFYSATKDVRAKNKYKSEKTTKTEKARKMGFHLED